MVSYLRAPVSHGGRVLLLLVSLTVAPLTILSQTPSSESARAREQTALRSTVSVLDDDTTNAAESLTISPTVALYFHPAQGASSDELVRRALTSNGELAAARLEIERARARLRQAGLWPNPTLDVEKTTGRVTGSAGESEMSVGVSLPLELSGQRKRRIELARVELEATEAEVADRERRLTSEVLALHAEALAALRELEITEGLTDIDLKTVVVVQARVNEGDTAPLELNLLRAEVQRPLATVVIGGLLVSTVLKLLALPMLYGWLERERVEY